ncbi:transmembrane protein, putative [Medicago truncatula]|uniref:Transmembrane protein, putative n=1 Tax=Medicago truncatula TaxID=3880 RepID=A0A072VD07_MEDTR|nr:transmembrane protein, putative [Medicago truncatula]
MGLVLLVSLFFKKEDLIDVSKHHHRQKTNQGGRRRTNFLTLSDVYFWKEKLSYLLCPCQKNGKQIGAGDVAGIIFGVAFVVLLVVGVYYVKRGGGGASFELLELKHPMVVLALETELRESGERREERKKKEREREEFDLSNSSLESLFSVEQDGYENGRHRCRRITVTKSLG